MSVAALVSLAMDAQGCNQKQLGQRLGVSPTQISKWKKGEHISSEMEARLRELANLSDEHPEFVQFVGTAAEAAKWKRLVHHLADRAYQGAETGYNTAPLKDEMGLLCWSTFHVLKGMGVTIPPAFPKELDFDYDAELDSEAAYEENDELLQTHPLSCLISDIYYALNNVYGFYAAYVGDLIDDDDLELFGTDAVNVEPELMSLAACKLEVDSALAPNFLRFRRQTLKNYREWLGIVKQAAFRSGVPLQAELLNLVYESDDALGHEAEAESLGFNDSRLHPDIYMNELLVGMRMIHQVLPAILKKLAIDKEFELDTSELRLGG